MVKRKTDSQHPAPAAPERAIPTASESWERHTKVLELVADIRRNRARGTAERRPPAAG